MSFKYFPIYRLESLIGSETLLKVSNILPALDASLDPTKIYTKSNLVRLLHSFFDSSEFSKKSFRTEFLSYQTDQKISEFCNQAGIDASQSFETKINQLVLKGWSDIEFCISFCRYFKLPEKFIPYKKTEYLNFEYANYPERPYKPLKDFQAEICFKAIKKLEYRNSRFILQMPTGSGKTRTAMEVITDTFIKNNEGCIIFWLVYSEELCEQAVECFLDLWEHVGTKKVKLIRVWGKNNLKVDQDDKFVFVVGGFQKLYNILQKSHDEFQRLKEKTFLIVVDEAHRVLAPTYKAVTDALFGANSHLIGLTATPGRGINNDLQNRHLSDYFNEDKINIDVPDGKSVFSFLKNRGIMAYVNYTTLISSPSFEMSDSDIKYLETNFDFSPSFIKKIGEDETRNFEIINELVHKLRTHKKVIFFACNIEHSKYICSLLNFLGIETAHVDGSTNKGARQAILKEFKNGSLQVICNYGILSTGFDAPKTDLVFIARPTQSIVLYSQMIGRGLRGKEVGGTETCSIITVRDNIIGLPSDTNIFTFFDEYFE